jgi:tetratricopeptide (TPR) repeat protein
MHYNNKEINYYGRFFDLLENEQETFTIRGIPKKSIELLEYSDLLKMLKEKYKSVTHENPANIPTLLTFSLSIDELAKQKIVEYLKAQGFQIDSYTIPLSELVCYYPYSKKDFILANGNVVLLLAATNTALHLMKLVFSDNYFMLDGKVKTCKGKGIDPRKIALVKFVVNEINNATGALSSDREKEEECEKMESKAEEWLKRIGAQSPNRPFRIVESFSKMPNAKKEVFVRNDNIEKDTGHYIQELMDIFDAYRSDNVRGDVAAIFLLGDCFQNTLVLDKFNKLIRNEKLFKYANKDIQGILSVYPKIDFKRYISEEERIKAKAVAEEKKKAEQLAFEAAQRKAEKEKQAQEAIARKMEESRKEAEKLYDRAVELEKEGKLQDAKINAENALSLDKTNKEYKQFLDDLIEKIDKLNAKNKLYKSYLSKGDKLWVDGDLEKALEEYEAAQSVFDNAEIIKKIIELKRQIKNIKQQEEKLSLLFSEVQSFINQNNFPKAKAKIKEILLIDRDNSEAKTLLSKIEESIQKQEKQRQEEEIKAKCGKILAIADNLFQADKWVEAKQQYEMALNLCPKEKSIQSKIKQCTDKIKDIESAFTDFVFDATIDEKKGKLKEALLLLEKAQQIKPDDSKLKKRIQNIKFKLTFETEEKPPPQKPKEGKKNDFLNNPTKNSSEKDDFWRVAKNKKANTETKNSNGDFLGIANKKTSEKKGDDDFLNIPKKKDKSLDF